MRHVLASVTVLFVLLTGAATASAQGSPTIAGCPAFPASSAWNKDISKAKVDPRSKRFVRSIGLGKLHPDFGSGRLGNFGIPLTVVPSTQPLVPITFVEAAEESDPGPYPIPLDAAVEGGTDDHVLVVQQGTCKLYELFDAERTADGFQAGSGAIFDLATGKPRPKGWTSADAAGLPIALGLARADEANAGAIRHALRVTVPRSGMAYRAPASHYASSDDDPNLPPMGLRLRLKKSYSLRGFTGQARVILTALRRYGLIVADNGSPWFVSGTADPGWHDAELNQLKRVPGSAFEAIKP
jgi:hypothetical protein